ncbi:MAG: hypothetical protein ACD_75C02646G0004 [uncultured bacterium]|nr:MAG: hypothetical protein ACD_75C02646G0004 [uncultured bacterium]
MSSSGKFGRKPDTNYFQGNCGSQDTSPEAQHIRVVVLTAHFCSVDVKTICGSDAPVPVGGYCHPYSGSADEYPSLAFSGNDAFYRFFGIIGIVDGIGRVTSRIDDLITSLSKVLSDNLLQLKTSVIGRKDNLHVLPSVGKI